MTSTDTKKKKEDPPPSEEQQQPHHVRAEEMTTTRSSNNNDDSATKKNDSNYCIDNLDPTVLQQLQSGAFEQLCQHLQTRSDLVSNMELMTISGFCRNCLAKWMVLEARRLVDNDEVQLDDDTKNALNAMGYEEAAQYVYGGMTYKDWKNRYQKKATNGQLERYQASASLHAKHDKELLQTRAEKKPAAVAAAEANNKSNSSIITVEEDKAASSTTNTTTTTTATTTLLQSNVCCQDPEDVIAVEPPQAATTTTTTKALPAQHHHHTTRKTNAVPAMYQPPPIPDITQFRHNRFPKIAIVTVSDRAFHNQYEHGDLSGPAVSDAIRRLVQPATETTTTTPLADLQFTMAVVPDESAAIQAKLKLLANDPRHDLILTTGGTGFAPRDVTPEATRDVVDYELPNMMSFVISESSHVQPLSSLSRGTAGILWNPHPTLIANLPGNPHAVNELVPLLLPLLLHGVVDLQLGTPEVLHIG